MLNKNLRLYNLEIPIIGITGGIGTGKSSFSKILQENGWPFLDADKLVKNIYNNNETILFIKSILPESVKDNKINFSVLRAAFFSTPNLKKQIENFIYQKLPEEFLRSLQEFTVPKVLFYEVPLLFEKNLEKKFDYIVTVYAPRSEQIKRVLSRDKSQLETIENILNSQVDIEEKKNKADFVIDNSQGNNDLTPQYHELIKVIKPLFSM